MLPLQLFIDAWHVTSRLGKALVLNPPSLTGWAAWFTLVIRTIVVLVVFRRNIAPFLLARITQRIRARSISIRSIKGLYFHNAGRTWKVDRIGWSFHPWGESPSRLSVRVEGLQLEIAKPRTSIRRHQPLHQLAVTHRVMAPFTIFREALVSLEWLWGGLLMSSPFILLRTAFSSSFILAAQLFIRYLPSLTQHLDFEIDSVVISFATFSGAQVRFRGVTLGTKVEFSQVGKDAEPLSSESKKPAERKRLSLHWNTVIRSGADRFWERVWGQTEGFAAVHVTVREIVGCTRLMSPASLSCQSYQEDKWLNSSSISSGPDFQLPPDVFLRIASPGILVSTQFSPKLLVLQQHSLDCSLDIPTIDASADRIQSLLDLTSADDSQEEQTRNTGHLLSSAVSRVSSPIGTPPTLISHVSPTSPRFITTFSHMARKHASISSPAPSVHRLTEPKIQPFATAIKSIAVCFPCINVVHSPASELPTPNGRNYLYTVESVDLRLSLSNPRTNQLHRKWLGSGSHSPLYGSVYSLVWKTGLATVSRLPGMKAPIRLLALHQLEMNLLAYQWPMTPSTAPRILSGDLNGPFVACELSFIGLHVTERAEELRTDIDSVIPKKRTRSPSFESIPTKLSNFPRLELLVGCNDVRVCLTACDTGSAHATSMLVLHNPGFHANLSTTFSTKISKAVWEMFPNSHRGDVHMNTTCYTFFHPTFVRAGLTHEAKDNTGYEWNESSWRPDPFLGVDGMELSMTCTTPGHTGHNDTVILEPFDSVLDVRCIFDDLSLELWKSETIATMLIFADVVRQQRNIKQAASTSTILDGLLPGVSIHLGIGRLSCAVTGPDINPLCGLELSRGLEVCTGVSIQCCYMPKCHAQRPRPLSGPLYAYDQGRRQLGLLDDLRIHAPLAHRESSPPELSALFQSVTWQSTCRNITSTRYEYGAHHGAKRGEDEDHFISMPRTFTTARLRGQRQSVPVMDMPIQNTCEVSLNIPHIRSRLDLHNLYSVLLASHTLQLFAPRHRHCDPHGVHESASIRTTFRLRLANVHIFCHLPLYEQLFIRLLSVTLEKGPDIPFKTECSSLATWVLSPHVEGKWEELSRLYGANVTVTCKLPRVKVAVSAEGFRIAIPHGYVLSRLILDVNVAMKTLRHLYCIVPLGYFIPLEPAGGEAPKNLLDLDIFIRSTTLEAADSPFEAKLGLIWRAGFQAQKIRTERELAFEAKLRAILASGDSQVSLDSAPPSDLRYRFTSKRTTSLADARARLNMVHSSSWISSISHQKTEIGRKEDTILRQLRHAMNTNGYHVPIPISVHTAEKAPPLFRAVVNGFSISLTPPCFPAGYQGFLAELGSMPLSTEYTLLLPMHLRCSLGDAMMNIRDYPLPLVNVPFHADGPSVEFVMDLIIAEEVGPSDSVEWFQCPIVPHNAGIIGARPFDLQVPKTIMPVKSYANPNVSFRTKSVTEFTWGVSYNPAIQEIMRVIETLSHPARDPSPAIGFWDKLRLVFHWRINATFQGGAHLHFKGSRDPYHIVGTGAGFDFRWDGNVAITVGHENNENELIQLSSNTMVITIPDHKTANESVAILDLPLPSLACGNPSSVQTNKNDRKICAKFGNGIRWGIGLTLERTCGSECNKCSGDTFNRKCRFFTFVPHYEVMLHSTSGSQQAINDSYAGFRSDFIHFSTSLTSPLNPGDGERHNSFHLTPKTFAHFWSWWHLFDSALSLPIRQGNLFPDSRPPSMKFGRHLATIKYRITFSSLYIAHVYKVDSGDSWGAGETHCVGVKAFLEHFQADMHQREEETSVKQREGSEPKVIRHKPFSAIDVVITGIDLRALFAVFAEPEKKSFPLKESLPSMTRFWEYLDPTPLFSTWVDIDDFMEVDWLPTNKPNLYLHEAAHCPRFVYFKRAPWTGFSQEGHGAGRSQTKFGDEETHVCLMGKEPSAHEVQLEFGAKRLAELRATLTDAEMAHGANNNNVSYYDPSQQTAKGRSKEARGTSITQMIALLERYTQHLASLRAQSANTEESGQKVSEGIYDMPTDIKLPEELGEFANVYQVHCPQIKLNNATRDILQQYYLASRARRGFEYHMSARAVKFIRDQAHRARVEPRKPDPEKRRARAGSAQAAAHAVRRMLTGDERQKNEMQPNDERTSKLTDADPLYGWDRGVSERKAHLCLLLKPQIVLGSKRNTHSILVLAADHVILRNYGILDTFNVEDPVSGYVMQRNYANIDSLQVFQPVDGASADHLPLEVFLDFRCESHDFDRLVPQTNATLRYDKFNRLRLRNDVTTVAISSKDGTVEMDMVDHLLHEMDLIIIQVPRFQMSADASAFASMADVVTDLLLFSDPVHKARMTQLETMLFSYDFTDLPSAAKVVADLQSRIRRFTRIEGGYTLKATDLSPYAQQDLLASKAHILALSQELNLIFDAIRLAQDKTDDRNQEKKSALRLQVSSSEISWQMLDENQELLAKLAVRGIDYSWLSRQDSSTTSVLLASDLQAFDGSPNALWPEILAKHDDPPTHRMIRRGLFAEAQWRVLAPVGGISIYDYFELELHPIRLALETQLGNKIVDYLIPGRRSRREAIRSDTAIVASSSVIIPGPSTSNAGTEPLDVVTPQFTVQSPGGSMSSCTFTPHQETKRKARPIASRSFSNLRTAAAESQNTGYHAPGLPKSSSSTALVDRKASMDSNDVMKVGFTPKSNITMNSAEGDASEMRQRSAQKTFVHVKVPSVHVLLSVMKGRGFLVRDARLRTHDLEWRNRTSSFEELINQFIPSDPSLRGWVKVAWQQPVFSVGGVVKELITKTQWGRLGKGPEPTNPSKRRKIINHSSEDDRKYPLPDSSDSPSAHTHQFPSQRIDGRAGNPEEAAMQQPLSRQHSASRSRVGSLFRRAEKRKPSP